MKTAKKICSFVLCLSIVIGNIVSGFAATADMEFANYVSDKNFDGDSIPSLDSYIFKDNTSYSTIVSREYDFSGTEKSKVETGIGGGFVNGNNINYMWGDDGTAQFTYKDQMVTNFYMRGTFNGIAYGKLSATYRVKLMQIDETVVFSYESRTQDSGTKIEHKVTVFGNDGKIGKTDVEYEADTWYDVTFEFDTAAGIADTFVNDIYVGTTSYTQNHGILGFLVYMPFNSSNTKYVFDHFKAVMYAPNYTFVAYTVTNDGETEGLEDFPIEGASAKIVFSEAISEIQDDDINFVSNGKKAEVDCELNENILLIMPKQRLSPRAKCTLSFPGITTVLGGVAAGADKIDFSVSPSDFSIESFSQTMSESDNLVILDVWVQNKMSIPNNVSLLCTVMRGGKMMSVASVTDWLLPESKNQEPYTLRLTLPDDYDESTDVLTLYLVKPDTVYACDELVVIEGG